MLRSRLAVFAAGCASTGASSNRSKPDRATTGAGSHTQALRRLVAIALTAAMALTMQNGEARRFVGSSPSLGVVGVVELPREGREVLAAIHAGGPFVSRRDGVVFGNREGFLPRQARGYYAEYTVPTPGARNRGARRIIAGRGATGEFRNSNEYYYTNDHYQSFRRIVQ